MPERLVINGNGATVSLAVHGYENEQATAGSDADWLRCFIHVRVLGFECQTPLSLTTQDLSSFAKSLTTAYVALAGEAPLETDEGQLRLVVTFGRSGTVQVEGEIGNVGRPKADLSFSFDSDQTFVKGAVEALEGLTEQYPTRSGST